MTASNQPPPSPLPPAEGSRPWYRRPSAIIIGALLLLIVLNLPGNDEPEQAAADSEPVAVVTERVTVDPGSAEAEARAVALDDREEQLDDREQQLDDREQQLDQRKQQLDQRKRQLDRRQRQVRQQEQRQARNTIPGSGIWIVGEDLQAGTWRTDGGADCYWARLAGLSGELDDIISNGNLTGPAVVEIAQSDAAFQTNGSCEWRRQ